MPDGPGSAAESPEQETVTADESFGWRGWVLVAMIVLSLLVIPWAIILLPRAQGFLASLGLGLRDAYLALPLVPAIGLATVAVWSAVAHRRQAGND